MFFLEPVHVNAEGEVLGRLEEIDLLLEQNRVGTQVDVLLPGDQPLDHLLDLRIHQGLSSGNTHDRRAAFIRGVETLLGGELLLENMPGVLDLAAAGAGKIAAEERLEHQHERIPFLSRQLVFQNVGSNRPHL